MASGFEKQRREWSRDAKEGLKGSEMLAVAVQLNQIQALGDSSLAEHVAPGVTITQAEA